MSTVKIQSSIPGTGTFAIQATQTGPNTAVLDVQEWANGEAAVGRPDSDTSYQLTNIVAVGDEVKADAAYGPLKVPLTITLAKDGDPPAVTLGYSVSIFWSSSATYAVSAADLALFRQWLSSADFPAQ